MAEVLTADGTTELLGATTAEDGEVVVTNWGSEGDSSSGRGSSSPGECQDGTGATWVEHWTRPYAWSFNYGSTPTNLNPANTETTIKKAGDNIVTSRNNCGIADTVTATHTYQGRTGTTTNISATNGCTTPDGVSVVSFGDLTSSKVGFSCWWYNGSYEMSEADMKLNKVEYSWWLPDFGGTCSGRYSVEAVMTHEFGHAFGLSHVDETAHGNLTMSSAINGPCQNSESTLGWGDVNILNVNY
jgi:hypothetical protein